MKNTLEYLRIVWVLTAKDIGQGLRNKNVLVLLFSAVFLILLYTGLPSLTTSGSPRILLIYDAGGSELTQALAEDPRFSVRTEFASAEAMRRRLAASDEPELGLVIPEGYDPSASALEGYTMYWLDAGAAAALKADVEETLSAAAGAPVAVSLEGNTVYGFADVDGAGTQAAMALIFALGMIGISLAPNMLFEEKQSRTLDALLVSPASETQIAAAKALTGLFFSGLTVAFGAAVNQRFILHWPLFIAAIAVYALAAGLVGLILGTVMENRAQFAVWAWLVILPLLMPVVLYLLSDLLPGFVAQILPVIPSVTALVVLRYTFADPITYGVPLLGLGWMLVWVAAELGLTGWLLRRRARGEPSRRKAAAPAPAETRARPETRVPAPAAADEERPADGWRAALRVTLAIAGKDIREAVHNRLVLSILIGTALVAVNGSILPALIAWRSQPSALVFDAGGSAAVGALAAQTDNRMTLVSSREEMDAELVRLTGAWIGLVIPADFDLQARSGGAEVRAFATNWTDAAQAAGTAGVFEKKLAAAVSAPVRVVLDPARVYPTADSGGMGAVNMLTQVLMLVVVGFTLVPLLLTEEKETRTMDMLRVSPAGWRQILAGKTLAGLAYCLVAGAAIALINLRMIVHWDIAVLTLALSSLFVVSVGLLIGTLADSTTSAAFWAAPLLLLSVVPALLDAFAPDSWPAWLTEAFAWSPTSVILRLFRLAAAGEAPAQAVWQAAGILTAMAAALYLLVAWITRKRAEE